MRSDNVTKGVQQAPHRSLMNALGMTEEEKNRPLIGIVNSYNEIVPGHMNLDKITEAVKLGVAMAGGTPVVFPAIAVCDGIAMGHVGMKYSLVTRDLIADSILDEALRQDSKSHMAVEATIKDDLILVYGEAGTNAVIDYEKIALQVMKEIGYDEEYHVLVKVNKQSSEINGAVAHDEISAGDQGIMFGYADDETEELMPYAIITAHKLAKKLEEVRRQTPFLRPDGKTQVTVEYDNGKPSRLDAVVLSTQHDPDITQEQIHEDIKREVFDKILPADMVDDETKFFINPTGRFVIGGPHGDAGLTGRKIIVDTYGGYARHGGGAFSGKDCTKVDRSAAYAARYVAKNIVAAGLADKCEIQLSYAIGVAEPTSIMVDTFGTGKKSNQELVDLIRTHFDLRPAGIIKMLDLRRPIYKQTAAYGHFGRNDLDLPWERLDKVDLLKGE